MATPSVGVVGAGIGGLAAAWLLARTCSVTLYEREGCPGGHCNTVDTPDGPVDTGFIVYNERNYPNLTALFSHLDVETARSEMSFGVSIDSGRLEYAGRNLRGMFVQRSNLFRPSFLRMIREIPRFYRAARALHQGKNAPMRPGTTTLGEFLHRGGYSRAFIDHHIIPMAAAIWSSPAARMMEAPLASFISFCANHGLLQLAGRPQWRTVRGGSRVYVHKLLAEYGGRGGSLRTSCPVLRVERAGGRLAVHTPDGAQMHDHVVLACHADDARAILADPTPAQAGFLSAFSYQANQAVLHTDERLMPRRRGAWCSWNYIDSSGGSQPEVCVTYWLNRLQPIGGSTNYFVTLNPQQPPRPDRVLRTFTYRHPLHDQAATSAQAETWRLQGVGNTWFCGCHLGFSFHEDGIQSGLAVAEAIGGVTRPWPFDLAEDRIRLPSDWFTRIAAANA